MFFSACLFKHEKITENVNVTRIQNF